MPGDDHGVLVLDKPPGATSHDVVQWVRWALRDRRVGHCGTLDPAATGVLVMCIGEATKLVEVLHADDKHYRATVHLGIATTTGDADGDVLTHVELDAEARARLLAAAPAAAAQLTGALELAPPQFSAIKQDGVPAHVRARRGEAVELAPRTMQIHAVHYLGADATRPSIDVELAVAKGTYVRAWAEALGAALGVPAHLASLRRLASGLFTLDDPRCIHGLHVAAQRSTLDAQRSTLNAQRSTLNAQRSTLNAPAPSPDTAPPPSTRHGGKPRVHLALEHATFRDDAAARLRASVIPVLDALPPSWPRAIAHDPERFERLCQGLPQWADAVGLPLELAAGPGAVAEPAGGRVVLVRLAPGPEGLRVVPTRVLRTSGPLADPSAPA